MTAGDARHGAQYSMAASSGTMRDMRVVRLSGIWLCAVASLAFAQDAANQKPAAVANGLAPIEPPEWLFPIDPASLVPADKPAKPDDTELLSVPGSSEKFTRARINDAFNPPDWRPASHTPMPDIVARGRKPNVMACAFCHLPGGQGRPENSPLAGLPEAYIRQQLLDYRSGKRKAMGPEQYLPGVNMVKTAKALTDAEIDESAKYFSQQKLRRRVYVIESLRIPRAEPAAWLYYEHPGTEDLDGRLLEMTQDLPRHELRDDNLEYYAYVPPGALNRGRKLVVTGNSLSDNTPRTVACSQCHLANLKGTDVIPPIAGRSPTYLLRQMLAFRNGMRTNEASPQMNAVVEKLTLAEMIEIVAYVASLPP
jgi:cytochrome c553